MQNGEPERIPLRLCFCLVEWGVEERVMEWADYIETDGARLAGKPVRLRFDARGAKLFSFRFG